MNTLNIKSTALTPAVNCNPSTGVIDISGRCLGVNPTEFWSEIQTWLLQYLDSPVEQTIINCMEHLGGWSYTRELETRKKRLADLEQLVEITEE